MDDEKIWREVFARQLSKITERQDGIEARMDSLESGLAENNKATARIDGNTTGIVSLMTSWDGTMKTLDGIARILKPLVVIGGVITGSLTFWWALLHNPKP